MSTPGDLLGALGREARARLGNGRSGSDARVYRGRTVEELIPRIQRELGADAIILRRREGLTGGVLGFFQHAWVEIEAVPGTRGVDVYDEHEQSAASALLDAPPSLPPSSPIRAYSPPPAPAFPSAPGFAPDPAPAYQPAPPVSSAPATPGGPAYSQVPDAPTGSTSSQVPPTPGGPAYSQVPHAPAGLTPSQVPPVPMRTPPVSVPPTPLIDPSRLFARETPAEHSGASAYVTSHLAALARADRARLAQRPSLLPEPPPPPAQRPSVDFHELIPQEPHRTPESSASQLPAEDWRERRPSERRTVPPGSQGRARAGVEKGLRRYGISDELIGELIDSAMAHALPLAPRSGLAAAVRVTLAQRIPVAAPLPSTGAAIVVVGAGGAGKTTTCAALLSAYRKGSTLRAGYATIIREPEQDELQMLLSPQLVKPTSVDDPRALRALRKVRSEGLVVLDTPWLSPADKTGIRRLARLLGELEPERVLVALPATLGGAPASQLLKALAPLKANGLAVTHAEETDQIGVAIEAACRFGLAPEYMLDRGRSGGWRLTRLDPTGLAAMVLP